MSVTGLEDPRKVPRTALELLQDQLVISNMVTREGLENYKGNPGRTVEKTVPGILPVREYAWGNDRSDSIVTDSYSETLVSATIGFDRPYSAIRWTDEDEFDWADAWGRAVAAQMDAVARGVEGYALNAFATAPYERVISVDNTPDAIKAAAEQGRDPFFNALVDAKSAISKFRVPYTSLFALASNSFADELEKNHKLTKNQGTGDSAFAQANIGTYAGVTFVRSNLVPDGQAVIFDKSAVVLFTAAPKVPKSAAYAASASANGLALTWIMDYDAGHLEDRSVFETLAGAAPTLDFAKQYDPNGASADKYFVRGVKLGLQDSVTEREPGDGVGSTPGADADSVLAKVFNGTLEQPTSITTGGGEPWSDYLAHPATGS